MNAQVDELIQLSENQDVLVKECVAAKDDMTAQVAQILKDVEEMDLKVKSQIKISS